jgi:hypothetical protein
MLAEARTPFFAWSCRYPLWFKMIRFPPCSDLHRPTLHGWKSRKAVLRCGSKPPATSREDGIQRIWRAVLLLVSGASDAWEFRLSPRKRFRPVLIDRRPTELGLSRPPRPLLASVDTSRLGFLGLSGGYISRPPVYASRLRLLLDMTPGSAANNLLNRLC